MLMNVLKNRKFAVVILLARRHPEATRAHVILDLKCWAEVVKVDIHLPNWNLFSEKQSFSFSNLLHSPSLAIFLLKL